MLQSPAGERSQAWRRTIDNTSLRRLIQAGRCQQTCTRASAGMWDVAVVQVRPARQDEALTSPTCGVSGRNVSRPRRHRATAPEGTIVSGPQCHRLVTSGGRYVNSRNVRGPQSQRAATTAWRDVSEMQRQSV